jgi:hypothetical protein
MHNVDHIVRAHQKHPLGNYQRYCTVILNNVMIMIVKEGLKNDHMFTQFLANIDQAYGVLENGCITQRNMCLEININGPNTTLHIKK